MSDASVRGVAVSKADEYRQYARDCLEVAQRMSLRRDRERVMGMAQRWLELAHKAEATCEPDSPVAAQSAESAATTGRAN